MSFWCCFVRYMELLCDVLLIDAFAEEAGAFCNAHCRSNTRNFHEWPMTPPICNYSIQRALESH